MKMGGDLTRACSGRSSGGIVSFYHHDGVEPLPRLADALGFAMIAPDQAARFLAEIDKLLPNESNPATMAIRLIANSFPHYKWVGVYWLEGDILVLGPFVGTPTEHDRIRVGQGVCGTAVAERKNQIVADVRQLSNYLACSLETRSEIVVLMREDDRIIGQIDADGSEVGAFDATDEALLTAVAERLVVAARISKR